MALARQEPEFDAEVFGQPDQQDAALLDVQERVEPHRVGRHELVELEDHERVRIFADLEQRRHLHFTQSSRDTQDQRPTPGPDLELTVHAGAALQAQVRLDRPARRRRPTLLDRRDSELSERLQIRQGDRLVNPAPVLSDWGRGSDALDGRDAARSIARLQQVLARAMLGRVDMSSKTLVVIRAVSLCVLASACAVSMAHAQPETFTAVAMAKGAKIGTGVANMTVTITHLATDAERDALLAAVKKGGTAAARTVLRGKADAGTLQLGSRPATIKYAYARSSSGGRLLTLITADPIVLLGAGLPDAKPAAGYDLGLVLLEVAPSGPGKGELVPAAKVKADAQGAIVTEDYSGETVQLSNVVRK